MLCDHVMCDYDMCDNSIFYLTISKYKLLASTSHLHTLLIILL